MTQEIRVLVEVTDGATDGAEIYKFTSPTKLGCFLEAQPNWLLLNGDDLVWVQQVVKNLRSNYSYLASELEAV